MKKIATTFLLVTAALLASAQLSTFDTGDDGWYLTGDASSPIPFYYSSGGNPGGYCSYTETQSGIYVYWNAPAGFLGNKSGSFRYYLLYDLKGNYCINQSFIKADVILQNGSLVIAFNDTVTFNNGNPDTAWTHYEIPLWDTLSRGHWWRDSINSGIRANNADIQSVLANLTSIKIRGEYTLCKDTGSIDNVILESAPASVNEFYEKTSIHLFPCPASDFLSVAFDKHQGETEYFITDLPGRKISSSILRESASTISVSALPAGIYFMHFKINDQWLERKFLINR